MEKLDYVNLVTNFIGDSAGGIPGYGGFITGIKNIGQNIAAVKQKERIFKFLHELEGRVKNIEKKFNALKNNEQFIVHFYKTLFIIRDTFDNNQYQAFLAFICEYLEGDFEDDEMFFIFDLLIFINPYGWKILKKIYDEKSQKWISAREFFLGAIKNENKDIDYKDVDYKTHKTLMDFVRLGILEEEHTFNYGDNSSGKIGNIKIGEIGERLIKLLQENQA